MKKKRLFISLLSIAPMLAWAQESFESITPTYLTNVTEAANWGRNWFVEFKGGASAFMGTPIGCGDVFDRLTPSVQIGVGKWFTPAVGGRLACRGIELIDANFSRQRYHSLSADFLFNLTSQVRPNDLGLSRWDVIPYFGFGLIRRYESSSEGILPFAFNYGIDLRYRISNHVQLTAGVDNTSASRSFDGLGSSFRLGDRLLSLSAGLSVSLGKVGYRRIIDAAPYMARCEELAGCVEELRNRNARLLDLHQRDQRIKAEYRKILEIEGLLDLYRDRLSDSLLTADKSSFPRNNYSGLNSLRSRIASREGERRNRHPATSSETSATGNAVSVADSIEVPIYFFFQINTAQLTEETQLLNIKELARIAKGHSLHVHIIGAADSATGTASINADLSHRRAEYIRQLMLEHGVPEDRIETTAAGGINDYTPVEANRHTCVHLSI